MEEIENIWITVLNRRKNPPGPHTQRPHTKRPWQCWSMHRCSRSPDMNRAKKTCRSAGFFDIARETGVTVADLVGDSL